MEISTKVKIKTYITDIILFDIICYSQLSDEDQFATIYLITHKLKELVNVLCAQSFRKHKEVVLGFIPTGDGVYIILNHNISGYGLFLALSLRTSLLQLKDHSKSMFNGLRTAVHFGSVIPIKDITGNQNFVGSGLNNCSRLLSVKKAAIKRQKLLRDDNFIIISSSALDQFNKKYSGEAFDTFQKNIDLKVGKEIKFSDKHGNPHKAHFIESNRLIAVVPPKPQDLKKRIARLTKKYCSNKEEVK